MLKFKIALLLLAGSAPAANAAADVAEVPVFITIGQSNADGSAMFDPSEDQRLESWYASDQNPHTMKIWYRSTQVLNHSKNALGEVARWCVDGSVTDVESGWLDLWYRNENVEGRTAMNMIHGFGTYSTGSTTACAQGRRGMEGEFGMDFAKLFPEKELYIIKLGVSGSQISTWANEADNHNWNYFFENVYAPAVNDLLSKGKKPVLAGVWWMQGCGDDDKSEDYYKAALLQLVRQCRTELGFDTAPFYIGYILAPGENNSYPAGSAGYSDNVRNAQNEVASSLSGVEILDTRNCSMQYEANFKGYIHFDAAGQNEIGRMLASKVADEKRWATFSTPGRWVRYLDTAVFLPSFGTTAISYSKSADKITATLYYDGWSDEKVFYIK